MNFIKNFRRKGIAIIALLAAAILFTGCNSTGKIPTDAVAVVNGNSISMDEYNKTLSMYKMNYEIQYGKGVLTEETESGLKLLADIKKQIVEKLVLNELIIQEAEKNSLTVKEEEVEAYFGTFAEYMEKNEAFKTFAEEKGIGEDFVKQQIRKDILVSMYMDFYIENLTISDDQAKTFYDENPQSFIKEEVKARHILLDEKPLAEKLLSRIKKGEDFIALAKEYSIEPGADESGGDLGYFPKGAMVPEFENVAFALGKGEISDIVETTFGYHIILVEDIKNETSSFENVKEDLKKYLKETEYKKHVDQLMENAKVQKRENM